MEMLDEAPSGENWVPWDAMKAVLCSPVPWIGWLLGIAGSIYSWRKQALDIGVGCLGTSCHYGFLLVVLKFSDWILFSSCSPASLDYLWWELGGTLLPTACLCITALPPLWRSGGLKRYRAAGLSVSLGFSATGLSVVGLTVLLYTPTAMLRAWLP